MTSRHYAVIGSPINHSLSPVIHKAAYTFLNLDWDYQRHEVKEGELASFLSGTAAEFSGLSVTMPLKNEAASLSTSGDDIVGLLGVANTLVNKGDHWESFNTDVFGLTKALEPVWSKTHRVSIIGAGATAQSALYSVALNAPEAKVKVFLRNLSNGLKIQNLGDQLGLKVELCELSAFATTQDLTINTIPNQAFEEIVSGNQSGWLLNVNYTDSNSSYLAHFEVGKVISGKAMLIWQAMGQLRVFINDDPSLELANEAILYERMASAL
jgi:shikimate dehydrogenase